MMGLLRAPGFASLKSWFVRTFNSRVAKVDPPAQQSHPTPRTSRSYSSLTKASTSRTQPLPIQPFHSYPYQTRGIHQFYIPKFNKSPPKFARIKFHPASSFLRPQIGAFPRGIWSSPPGGTSRFHTSPSSSALVLNQIAHSVSTALKNGKHPQTFLPGTIVAQVASRAACQTHDGPAGYIRFTLSPPVWTPIETDLSDPDVIKAIDTHIDELQRIKKAILKLKKYGDFPVRTVLPSNSEATIDVLFRGASVEDVARWNKNEFKLSSGHVGVDQVFCAGRFEEFVRWSDVLDVEKKVEREMKANVDGGVLKFWEELNMMEGRIR